MERNHLQGIKWVLHICLALQLTPLEYECGRVKVTTCRNHGAHCGSLLVSIRKVDLLALPRSTNMVGLCRQLPKCNTGLIHVEESFRADVVLYCWTVSSSRLNQASTVFLFAAPPQTVVKKVDQYPCKVVTMLVQEVVGPVFVDFNGLLRSFELDNLRHT